MLLSMTVMAREAWTDERLDDLSVHVDRRFDQVDQRFDQVDQRFERVEADIRELRSDMKTGFAEVNARFDSMQRTMIIGFVTLFASIVASVIGGVLATQL
jgi:hypothetical protein